MYNEVKRRDEICVGKPQNTLCLMTKEISILNQTSKNTTRFWKVSDCKNEGMEHIRVLDRSSFPQFSCGRLRLPEILDSQRGKVAMLSTLCTGRLYPPGDTSVTRFC
jgi:hypothetical protein